MIRTIVLRRKEGVMRDKRWVPTKRYYGYRSKRGEWAITTELGTSVITGGVKPTELTNWFEPEWYIGSSQPRDASGFRVQYFEDRPSFHKHAKINLQKKKVKGVDESLRADVLLRAHQAVKSIAKVGTKHQSFATSDFSDNPRNARMEALERTLDSLSGVVKTLAGKYDQKPVEEILEAVLTGYSKVLTGTSLFDYNPYTKEKRERPRVTLDGVGYPLPKGDVDRNSILGGHPIQVGESPNRPSSWAPSPDVTTEGLASLIRLLGRK